MREPLRAQLPESYAVFVESEAVWVTPVGEAPAAIREPDVAIARPHPAVQAAPRERTVSAAVLEIEESCELVSQYSLVVRRVPENTVVAVCEMLSPTNKGAFGQIELEKYVRKRAECLAAGISFLEIDALLGGERRLPPSLTSLHAYERFAWSAFHPAGKRIWRAWGWNREEPQPVVPWRVEEPHEVLLDLGATLRDACAFNPWEALTAGAARGGTKG